MICASVTLTDWLFQGGQGGGAGTVTEKNGGINAVVAADGLYLSFQTWIFSPARQRLTIAYCFSGYLTSLVFVLFDGQTLCRLWRGRWGCF